MNKAEKVHCTAVASLGCIVCGQAAELHHVMMGAGLSQRASHFKVIPLCGVHHRTGQYGEALHAGIKHWEELHGTEEELLFQVDTMVYSVDDVVTIRDPEYKYATG